MSIKFFQKRKAMEDRIAYLEGRVRYFESAIKDLREENFMRIGKLEDCRIYFYPHDPRPAISLKEVVQLLLNHVGAELKRTPKIEAENKIVKVNKK